MFAICNEVTLSGARAATQHPAPPANCAEGRVDAPVDAQCRPPHWWWTGAAPLQAIKIGTARGARLLRLEVGIGAVRPGSGGDLLAATRDPTREMTRLRDVRLVVAGGRVHRRTTDGS
jgi:hypothetical protein